MSRSSTTFLRTETLELRGDRASNTWCRKCMPGPVTTNLHNTRELVANFEPEWIVLTLHTVVHYPAPQTPIYMYIGSQAHMYITFVLPRDNICIPFSGKSDVVLYTKV